MQCLDSYPVSVRLRAADLLLQWGERLHRTQELHTDLAEARAEPLEALEAATEPDDGT